MGERAPPTDHTGGRLAADEPSGIQSDEDTVDNLDLSMTSASGKFADILSMLDSAAAAAQPQTQPAPPAPSSELPQRAQPAGVSPASAPPGPTAGAAGTPPSVSSGGGVSSIKARLQEMKATIASQGDENAALRRALERKAAEVRAVREDALASAGEAVQRAKAAAEETAARHLSFIDKLLGDKKRLAARCEELVGALEGERHAATQRARQLREEADATAKRIKAECTAGEKARLQSALERKETAVRAAVMRSLEPDIQRLMDKHKDDLGRLKEAYAKQLHEAETRISESKQGELLQLRGGMDAAVRSALEGERRALRERELAAQAAHDAQLAAMRKQAGEELAAEQRRGLDAVRAEVSKAQGDMARQRAQYEEQIQALSASHAAARSQIESSTDQSVRRARRQLEAERESLRSDLQRELQGELVQRAQTQRTQLQKEADEALRAAIQRLDAQMQAQLKSAREGIEARANARVAEVRADLARAHSQCDTLRGQLAEAQGKVGSAQQDNSRQTAQLQEDLARAVQRCETLQARVATLEGQLEDSRSQLTTEQGKWSAQRAAMQESARAAAADADTAQRRLQHRLEDARREHDAAAAALKAKHAKAAAAVQERVSAALAQREASIAALRQQVAEEQAAREHAQTALQRERAELMAAMQG